MAPGADLVCCGASQTSSGDTPACPKRQRIRSPRELFALGIELMQRAEADEPSRSPRDCAVLYRDGLMMALLSSCPLRLRNLLGLMIGQHLMRRGDAYWVVFQAEETKTRRPIEVPLPRALTAAIDRYIEEHRPCCCAVSAMVCWLRPRLVDLERANVLSPSAAHSSLTTATLLTRRQHQPASLPRLCRYAIMIEDPEHAHIAAIVLGHASLATTDRYYVHAQASRRPAAIRFMVELRRQLLKTIERKMMTRAVIYCRYSSTNQRGHRSPIRLRSADDSSRSSSRAGRSCERIAMRQ
jgi:integrase